MRALAPAATLSEALDSFSMNARDTHDSSRILDTLSRAVGKINESIKSLGANAWVRGHGLLIRWTREYYTDQYVVVTAVELRNPPAY